jgi:AraC-like DNA-binding protein
VSYQERPPVARLAGLVATTWVHEVPADAAPYRHREVPNGCVELRCRLDGQLQLAGPFTGPRVELLPPGTTVVGVRFRPAAAAAVLGLPPAELADSTVDAGHVWGRQAAVAGERAAEAPEHAAAVLQELVVARLTEPPDPLVAEAVRRLRRAGDIGRVQSGLAISERQFRRRCESATGVAPKALHRMLRFQGFLALTQFALMRGRRPAEHGLAQLAADAGYADQAHLARECLRLTGDTPKAFLRQTEQQCGCGHDHAVSFTPLLDGRFVQERRAARP